MMHPENVNAFFNNEDEFDKEYIKELLMSLNPNLVLEPECFESHLTITPLNPIPRDPENVFKIEFFV